MPVTGADGTTRMVRSCVEGPVFRGDRVRWDAFETTAAAASRPTPSGAPTDGGVTDGPDARP